MDIPWYQQAAALDQLRLFGRAIQGIAPYEIVIEPDFSQCPGGCCNFEKRRITVNPILFHASDKEQYLLTKALLVHEAGHRRHTIPTRLPEIVLEIANILEDERVEVQMCEEFLGLRWLVHRLAQRFYDESGPIDVTSTRPNTVVEYFLQLRWATRIGRPVKGALSPINAQRWEAIKSLVLASWHADTSTIVDAHAATIVNILGLNESNDLRRLIQFTSATQGSTANV